MNTKYHYDNNYAESPKILNDLYLYQLGEMMCDIDTVMLPHAHLDWFEVTYVFSGKGLISTNNTTPLPVEKGDLYFSHPKEIHAISSDTCDPLRFFFFAFNFTEQSLFTPLLKDCKRITLNENNRKFRSPALELHFNNLLSEIRTESELGTLILEYELKLAFMKIYQIIKSETVTVYHAPKNNSVQILSFNLLNYIDRNFLSIENTSCLSNLFGYNYSYLSRCFKKVIGTSVSDYIINKKMNLAKELLEKDNISITRIADTLNYSSIYAFSRIFKTRFNISPSEYKQKFKKEKT